MKKLLKYIKQPLRVIIFLCDKGILHISDEKYLKINYKISFNKKLNLKNPQTFNEKLQWLKLYDRKDVYTRMVDKYDAKDYVADLIGLEYIIPTLGIYDNFEQIDFDKLPNQFVIKVTHYGGSNGVYIVKDKDLMDVSKIKKSINKLLKKNLYNMGREWPYKNIKPRILIEKYMEDVKTKELRDYKFFCFNGNVESILVCSERNVKLKETFFDLNWKVVPYRRPKKEQDLSIEKPINLNSMIKLANKLSKDIPFLRVDFYEINGKIYFGELTFFPASGFVGFEPEEWDLKLGQLIDLSKVGQNEK